MIEILDFKNEMQIEIKKFVIENMKKELNIENKEVFSKVTIDLDNIDENYIKNGGVFLVAFDTEKNFIVGTISIKFENNFAILKRFYVDEKYRNMKIGLLLYKTLEERIIYKNIKEVYLVSGKHLINARKFYERNGWEIEENNPGIYVRNGAFLFKKNFIN